EHPVSADVSVNDCFRPVSRFFDRISRPEQILTALPEAMRVLTSPVETGTVTLALPQDVQAHAYDYPAKFFEPCVWPIGRPAPNLDRVAEAIALLKHAKRPVIIAGGGVHYAEAWDELQAFAETCGIPVVETFAGKGAIRRDSPWLLGGGGVTGTPPAAQIESKADLVIAIGTRLTDFTTGSQSAFSHPQVKFIAINVVERDACKQGALPIVADAREALRALIERAKSVGLQPRSTYGREVAAAKQAWAHALETEVYHQVPGEAISQGQLIGILNKEAQPGDTVIAAAGGAPGDLMKLWDTSGDRPCHIEFGYSCMGYELPAGLGVRMAHPSGEIYVLIGDGTYLMNPMELVTAAQEKLKVTVVVADNHGFQVIRQLQMNRAGRSFGNEFRARDPQSNRLEGDYLPVDYARNAESMGARAWHVATETDLRAALAEARQESRPCVIVVEVEKHRYLPGAGVWWDVASAEATRDPVTRKLRHQYERERARRQRYYR
ncbi:MAG: 3D-(3,5/4)-trihydroxycyclohexane-1,2-dione acylhydrolase (decyclizing), partial [Chloroflexi bacterium]|nr:3D-(3,5/4)-trihydroxycyclohexane-1,2-dione acylhydrolase (decyclizing) [Chloroflexota bacterium]